MNEDESMIEIADMSFSYGPKQALSGITLTLSTGVTCVAGLNGSGKSTLLDIVAGFKTPTSGTITSRNTDLTNRVTSTGYLPQSFSFVPSMTILDTIALSLWLRGVHRRRIPTDAHEALEAVGLTDQGSTPMGRASGGMVRRAGFAVATAHKPDVLILDEPTTGVDAAQRRAMRELIAEQASGRTVLMSSHIAEDIEALADALVILRQGEVAYTGSPAGALTGRADSSMESAIIELSR